MADWFKFYENGIHESRFQWAIHEEAGVCSVWLWILSECCRTKSDSFPWTDQDFELFGVAQLTNVPVPRVNIAFNLLKQIKYVEILNGTLKVLKWNKFQSDYMRKLSKTPDNVRTNSGVTPDKVGVEERRGEDIRREESASPPTVASLPLLLGENSIPEETVKSGERALKAQRTSSKKGISKSQNLPIGREWCREYERFHSKPYVWSYGDDQAVSTLETAKISIEEISTVIRSTWNNKDSFWFGKVNSISFFAKKFNDLRAASDSYRSTELKPSKPTGCFAEDDQ